MSMECYLDNSATTRCSERASAAALSVMKEDYGNPSSLHNKGLEAEAYIRNSRSVIAKSLKCKPENIIFTSGGSESNNLAIFGAVNANLRKGKHIITTNTEHAAVYQPMKRLEELGYEVSYLEVDRLGRIDLSKLKALLREDTVLVSIIHVNNEIGALQPVEEAAKIIHEVNKDTIFHVDAIQSYGKLKLYPGRAGIDMLSVSGHKLHAPKGSGFLFLKEGLRIEPLIYGGGQERGLRSGTENVPAIAGLGVAVEEMFKESHFEKLAELKEDFIKRTCDIEGVSYNGISSEVLEEIRKLGENPSEEELSSVFRMDGFGAPHIVSMSVRGVRAEVLLHALEDKGVYCSAGSACSSNKPAISRTLKAIGLEEALLDSTVRFSFSIYSTKEETAYAAEILQTLIPVLNKYTRK